METLAAESLAAEATFENSAPQTDLKAALHAESEKQPSAFLMLVWVYAIMSVVGLVGETLQHYVAFGEWESRAGYIWGPFSPIYGLAAALLTILALGFDKQERVSNLKIFVVAAFVGGGLEYFASWAMETFWGIVAWSYLDAPLNFSGRTDVFHMVVWGLLGLAWVRIGYPLVKKAYTKIDATSLAYRIVSWALAAFLVCDTAMTIAVLLRADARTHGIEATTPIEMMLDENYPNEVLQARFQNMGGIGRAD